MRQSTDTTARSPKVPGPGCLTTRESDVLAAVARGLDNRMISVELRLSDRTVRNYVSRIYQKLGVTNRVEAVLWWARQHGCTADCDLLGGRS